MSPSKINNIYLYFYFHYEIMKKKLLMLLKSLVLLYKKHLDANKKNVINNDNDFEILPRANFINGFA